MLAPLAAAAFDFQSPHEWKSYRSTQPWQATREVGRLDVAGDLDLRLVVEKPAIFPLDFFPMHVLSVQCPGSGPGALVGHLTAGDGEYAFSVKQAASEQTLWRLALAAGISTAAPNVHEEIHVRTAGRQLQIDVNSSAIGSADSGNAPLAQSFACANATLSLHDSIGYWKIVSLSLRAGAGEPLQLSPSTPELPLPSYEATVHGSEKTGQFAAGGEFHLSFDLRLDARTIPIAPVLAIADVDARDLRSYEEGAYQPYVALTASISVPGVAPVHKLQVLYASSQERDGMFAAKFVSAVLDLPHLSTVSCAISVVDDELRVEAVDISSGRRRRAETVPLQLGSLLGTLGPASPTPSNAGAAIAQIDEGAHPTIGSANLVLYETFGRHAVRNVTYTALRGVQASPSPGSPDDADDADDANAVTIEEAELVESPPAPAGSENGGETAAIVAVALVGPPLALVLLSAIGRFCGSSVYGAVASSGPEK